MKSKTYIEGQILIFKKSDLKRKKVTIEENFYILLSKSKDEIKGSLIFRINKNKERKVCDIVLFKEKGKYRIDYEHLEETINTLRSKKPKESLDKNTKRFGKYFEEFKNELESKIKSEVDISKKALLNFNKYFSFWENRTEKDIDERNLIDFCNYVAKNAKPTGSAVGRDKEGCYAIRMAVTTLRKFLNFLFLKGVIKKETLNTAKTFIYVEYFTHCKKLQQKQTAFNHFKSLEDVRSFYDSILNIRQYLEDFVAGDDSEKEYIATELLKYKQANLLTMSRAQDFLYKMYVTEFLLLTGIRGIDFFKISIENIKWQDKFIYFPRTKNQEEYYLFLTDYLYNLAFNIYNLAKQITQKDTFIATTHSTLRNFFNTFYRKQLGFDINIHGFRHTLKTLATKYLNYSDYVIEEQIQHNKKGLDKNYMQGNVREQRLKLLEDYRLLITPLHYKYYFNEEDKQRTEEKVKAELERAFTEIINRYNITRADLTKILLKYF